MCPHLDLPETFYLDHDRLKVLALEISDIVHLQICFDAFNDLCRQTGCTRSSLSDCGASLRSNILAVVGGRNGSESWRQHSKDIAVALIREVASSKGTNNSNYERLVEDACLARHLQGLFYNRFLEVASRLQLHLMPLVFESVQRHIHSPAMDLFNIFTVASAKIPLISEASVPFQFAMAPDASKSSSPGPEHSIANRLAHIIILHWQTWADLVYIADETALELQSKPPTFSGESEPLTKKSPTVSSVSSSSTASVTTEATSLSPVSTVSELIEIRHSQNSSKEALGFAGSSAP